jgi:NADPH:quinone reductase
MRAVIMAAPATDGSTTRVADIDEPQPGPGQVAIDVAYAGVNFIDVMARRGDPGYASAWPYVPGLEVAGTIRSVGSGVHDLHAGDRVAALTPGGGMAEVAIAAAEVTVGVPPDAPLGTAASAPLVVSTALLLLTDRARIRPGESVLMHSASGGIGSVVSQVAAALGSGRLTIVEPLESVAAIHDLLAAGRGSGKYVIKVHG